MYPEPQLIRLAASKAALRGRIHARRAESMVLFAGVLRPVAWLDRALGLWRRLSPFATFAAIPLALVLRRTGRQRGGIFGTLLRWGPAAFGLLRSLRRR
jgi:hypothetical protein